MKLYITGDTHHSLDVDKLSELNFTDGKNLTRDDYLVILGDFGCPKFNKTLDDYDFMLDFYETSPYTVLFLDGNHENFKELNKLKIENWNGGKVHKLRDNIIHLMRGQVYTLGDKTIFTFGGAYSPDKHLRVEGFSWFKEESCNYIECEEAIDNLEKHNFKVDYVLTHTCSANYLKHNCGKIGITYIEEYSFSTEKFLDTIEELVQYKKWLFGHLHVDKQLDSKHTAMYNRICRLI